MLAIRRVDSISHGDMVGHMLLTDRKHPFVISQKRSVFCRPASLHYQMDLVPRPRLTNSHCTSLCTYFLKRNILHYSDGDIAKLFREGVVAWKRSRVVHEVRN
jgi:hypothetical protein